MFFTLAELVKNKDMPHNEQLFSKYTKTDNLQNKLGRSNTYYTHVHGTIETKNYFTAFLTILLHKETNLRRKCSPPPSPPPPPK